MWYIGDVPIVERNHGLIVSLFLFTTLAVLAVLMRTVTRFLLVRNVGIDDYFIIVSMFGTIAFLIAAIHQVKFGLGDSVDFEKLPHFLQSLWVTIVAYSVTHTAIKFSILFQCKRIFTEPVAQRIFLSLMIWLGLYSSFCIMSSIITCWPIHKYWDDTVPGGCIERSNLHYALAGFNILNDVLILAAPLPFLRKLQIPRRAKIILIAVFACAGFACIVAIIRLHSLWVNNSAPIDQQPIKGVDIAIWSSLEINVAIICASVPALKPLFAKVFPHFISSLSGSHKRSRYGNDTGSRSRMTGFRSHNKSVQLSSQAGDSALDHGIKVQQSFEMKALQVDGDDTSSEKNLVTCYAAPSQGRS